MPSTEPAETAEIAVSFNTAFVAAHEYLLNVELLKNDAEPWCESGYSMATEQFMLQERSALAPVDAVGTLSLVADGGYTVSNDNITFSINSNGFVTNWVANDVQVLEGGDGYPVYSNIRWIENESPYGKHEFGDATTYISSATVTASLSQFER